MGVSPYNSWYKEEAIEVCVAVWVLFQYPLFQRWEHRVHHCTLSGKAWSMKSMHILSEVCYFIYNHNKRQQPIVSLGRGQGTVMGC